MDMRCTNGMNLSPSVFNVHDKLQMCAISQSKRVKMQGSTSSDVNEEKNITGLVVFVYILFPFEFLFLLFESWLWMSLTVICGKQVLLA